MVKMIFWSRVINHDKINRGMVSGGKGWVVQTLKAQLAVLEASLLRLSSLTLSWAFHNT